MPDYSHIDQALIACFSPTFKRQIDIRTALPTAVITKRHPFIQPSKPTRTRTRRVVYHCNGIDIYEEKITDQFSRWTFGFPADAGLIAGWMAMNYGSALAPTGASVNEVQTLTGTGAAADTFKITATVEGRTGTTRAIAFDATNADIKAALTSTSMPFEDGDIATITGDLAAGLVITFGKRMANADIPALSIADNQTGGTFTVDETTKGDNYLHNIARSTSVELPLTSFIIGWEEDTTFIKHKGFACDVITIEAQNREDLGVTVQLVGSADTEEVIDYVVPACQTINPIEVDSCRLIVDGEYLLEDLSGFKFERNNGIPVGKGSFPFADKNIGLIWRGSKPTEEFTFGFYGSEAHPLYRKAENETKHPIIAHLGNPGDRYSIIAPQVKLKLADTDLTFDNDLRRSVANIVGTPHYDETINASSRGEARISQSAAFLTEAN